MFILLFFLLVSVAGRYRREPMTHVRNVQDLEMLCVASKVIPFHLF